MDISSATLRVEFFPADLDVSIAFYERLGFALVVRKATDPPYASMRFGHVRLGLCRAPAVDPALRAVPRGAEIVVEVDDIDKLYDDVRRSGIERLESLSTRAWGLRDFRLTDPDGYYLRFTERGE